MNDRYENTEPTREVLDAMKGPVLVEFGTSWCGHCLAAKPLIAAALAHHPGVRHIRIPDAKGLPLGRSFNVTLWPTLVLMRDGKVVETLVRPRNAEFIRDALARIR